MLTIKYGIAILIVIVGIIASGYLYWFVTKKWIRFHAKLWYGLRFKEMAEEEGVKVTYEEKQYLKKYLIKMLICGAVLGGGMLLIFLVNVDLTYFKLYPLKTIVNNPELLEKSELQALIGCIFMFIAGFIAYPYKGILLLAFPFGKGRYSSYDDYDD
jgi:hypothetical protein